MASIIPICIGNAGIQVSHKLWELLGIEHRIGFDGKPLDSNQQDPEQPNLQAFYHEVSTRKYKLNAVALDLGSSSIDAIRDSPLVALYESNNLISS
jgi:hypothetical protein